MKIDVKGELNQAQLKQSKRDVFKLGNLLKKDSENDELPLEVKSISCRLLVCAREWLSLHCHGPVL